MLQCRKVQNIEQYGGDIVEYDYSKLKGRIVEIFGTFSAFAFAMGFSERTLSLKINNRVPFKQPEIQKAIVVLNLKEKDILPYYFTPKVQNIEQN